VDLFEILFVVLFILFPIMEQVLKRKRSPGPPGDEADGQDGAGDFEASQGLEREPPARESGKASDMVPDDLWAVLTGEQRPPQGPEAPGRTRETSADDPEPVETPWSSPTPERGHRRRGGASAPWSIDDDEVLDEPAPAPVSLEQYGPEAYTLERLDYEAESLERPVPSAEARHRDFHELVDRPEVRRPSRRGPLSRALRSPGGLRQAFVLNEVLGPPKGLDD